MDSSYFLRSFGRVNYLLEKENTMKYYFDNEVLQQFVMTGADVQVVIDGDILELEDAQDVQDPKKGYGSDMYGKMYEYDYMQIDYIIVDGYPITIDAYVKSAEEAGGGEEEEDAGSEDTGGEEETSGDEGGGEEEEPAEEEGGEEEEEPAAEEEEEEAPTESRRIKVGDFIMNTNRHDPNYMTRGSVVLVEQDHILYQFYTENGGMVRRGINLKYAQKVM